MVQYWFEISSVITVFEMDGAKLQKRHELKTLLCAKKSKASHKSEFSKAKRYTQKHLFAPCLEMEFDVLTKKLPGLAIERLFVANHCQISGTIMAQGTVTR
jgi:hypothetical protein